MFPIFLFYCEFIYLSLSIVSTVCFCHFRTFLRLNCTIKLLFKCKNSSIDQLLEQIQLEVPRDSMKTPRSVRCEEKRNKGCKRQGIEIARGLSVSESAPVSDHWKDIVDVRNKMSVSGENKNEKLHAARTEKLTLKTYHDHSRKVAFKVFDFLMASPSFQNDYKSSLMSKESCIEGERN